ncbi:MAG: hypothetical protein ACMUIL_08040 [bacterium]
MKRILRYAVIISFITIVVFLGLFRIVNFDFGWHLKAGEYIVTNRSIPTQDIFSYIAGGNKWVDSHWLFQVVLFGWYVLGGATGVIFFRILLLTLTFLILLFTIYREEYLPLSILVCLFPLFISFQRFLLRPELFTFLFLALFLYCMEHFSEHPRLFLVIIPLCQALWANMHGLHILGVVFVFLYLLGDGIQAVLSGHTSLIDPVPVTGREWKQRGLLLGLTAGALLANANGTEGILYPFRIFRELTTKQTVFSRITELVSPFAMKHAWFPDPSIIYKIFLVISILVILCRLRHVRFAHLLPFGAFLYLSVLAVRNMPLFAIVATPITIHNVFGILDFFAQGRAGPVIFRPSVFAAASACLILLIGLLCAYVATNGLYRRLQYLRAFGLGESDYYPAEAVEYLRDKDFEGNIFNSSDIGGYLIWKLYPRKQVSLDGRWEVYGDFLNTLQQLRNPYYFAQLTARYTIEVIVLHKRSWEIQLMTPWLRVSRVWAMTMNAPNAVVFERRM